ncbi:MAG: VOC family protein [Rhodanobacteraceae bacterium]
MTACALRLLRVDRNVADLDRARSFYCEALGFSAIGEHADAPPEWTQLPGVCDAPPRSMRLRLGEQEIELTSFAQSAPYPLDSSAADLWFQHCAIVVDDMDAAYARLRRHGDFTAISRDGPQTLPSSSGGVTAFKFRDPDGHPLELIFFPSGSGDPVWQHAQGKNLTLGMDHSAISVFDADRSIVFYTALGMSRKARQANRGAEQEKLDALANVEVEVVALQPAETATPHIELLAYRTPRGRALANMEICDIAADRLVLQVQNLPALLDALSHSTMQRISNGMIGSAGDPRAALLRDPDGHWLVLVD